MEKNKVLKLSIFVLLGIIFIILLILGQVIINSFDTNSNKNPEKIEDNDYDENQKEDNNYNIDEEYEEDIEEDENEYYEFSTQLPTFKDDFEKAMFIYGWFHCGETLRPYIDRNEKIEENYNLLKIENFKTIQDMKDYAYEVFDKEFIDAKFVESTTGDMVEFKENNSGVLVLLNANQYLYKTGYTDYNEIKNQDGTITYKVNIKENLMGDDYSCDTTYEYKMEKNNKGKLVFKTFESPANICLNDANSKQ